VVAVEFSGVLQSADAQPIAGLWVRDSTGRTADCGLLLGSRTQAQTGFSVRIREKAHEHLLTLVEQRCASQGPVDSLPGSLLTIGNCVPAALWHLSNRGAEATPTNT
jgi:hypothetical protein